MQCVLCQHNPRRLCETNFAPKYFEDDYVNAKCDAPIRVEVISKATGQSLDTEFNDVYLEVSLYQNQILVP